MTGRSALRARQRERLTGGCAISVRESGGCTSAMIDLVADIPQATAAARPLTPDRRVRRCARRGDSLMGQLAWIGVFRLWHAVLSSLARTRGIGFT